MTVEESFNQSDLLNLATLVESQLVDSLGIYVDRQKWSAKVAGVLNLSHDKIETDLLAYCAFEICHDWWKNVPAVYCNEYWVKKDTEFHIGLDGWICFDLDLRWQKYVTDVLSQEGMRAAALYGAAWCVHHCRWLLYRHHYFFANNISKWPNDLPAWGHGDDGRREFLLNEFKKRQRKG